MPESTAVSSLAEHQQRCRPPSFVGRLPPPLPDAVELLSLLLLLRRPLPSLPSTSATFSLATVDRRLLPLNTTSTVDPRFFLLPTPLASFFAAWPLLLTLLFLLFSTFDHRDLLPRFLLSSTVHASPHLGSVDPPFRWPFTVAGTLGFTSPAPSSSRCHLPSLFSLMPPPTTRPRLPSLLLSVFPHQRRRPCSLFLRRRRPSFPQATATPSPTAHSKHPLPMFSVDR